jgi:DNA mismatch repair ATPase MutS
MKAFLMYKDLDFDLQQKLPWNIPTLIQDLELNIMLNAMALGDDFLLEVVKKTVFSGLNIGLDTIRYRQNILKDCLKNSSIVRSLYQIPVEAMETKKKNYWSWGITGNPSLILSSSVKVLQMFANRLEKLRNISDEHADKFESEGFQRLFAVLKKELNDEYLGSIQRHLKELEFRHGVLVSADLGKGNEGTNYILRKPHNKQSLAERVFTSKSPVYRFSIEPGDIGGGQVLSELNNRAINLVANAVAQSADHIDSFFNMLRIELAFYVGCLNLYEQLLKMGEPITFPLPVAANERRHSFSELYDICLALTMKQKVVGNDVNADNKDLVIITGANQGGKSTFLRSIGLAQLMMQCGMFVPAKSFSANICNGIFTHFKREEDINMKSGKLDEELKRMSEIVDHLATNSLLLFNESFAATNEREGSEIARQITSGLLDKGIKVFFVTHQYEFAHSFYARKMGNAIFLRAERRDDGTRTFKLVEGEPLQTSYGEDLYKRIFLI